MNFRFIRNTVTATFMNSWLRRNKSKLHLEPTFLASFPRSGNGWIRLIVAELLLVNKGYDLTRRKREIARKEEMSHHVIRAGDQVFSVETLFPDIYQLELSELWKERGEAFYMSPSDGLYIKTHHAVPCSRCRTILLFRNPIESITSYYNMVAGTMAQNQTFEARRFQRDIIKLAGYYARYTEFFLKEYRRHPNRCFFLDHGRFVTHSTESLASVAAFLEVDAPISAVNDIVGRNPFRSGYDKRYREKLTPETVQAVDHQTGPGYAEAMTIAGEHLRGRLGSQ